MLEKRAGVRGNSSLMAREHLLFYGTFCEAHASYGGNHVASSYVAIAVRVGASKPDIGSADALKRSVLAAKSIVHADPAKGGASGVYFAKVLERLGIADQMKPKTILVPGAQAAEVVARGEAEMGVAQASGPQAKIRLPRRRSSNM